MRWTDTVEQEPLSKKAAWEWDDHQDLWVMRPTLTEVCPVSPASPPPSLHFRIGLYVSTDL